MVLAVNLSAVQFNQPDLAARVVRAIELAGLPRGCLELELTEVVAMRTPTVAARRMEELRAHDVRLAIDDFGTGYSSLSYLKQFNVNRLKIDQSFVRDIGSDPDDQAITIAIIQMARSLGVRTIAEGVETAAQWAFLRAHGCEQGQGYHFSHPLPPDRFERYVRDRMPAAIASGHPPLAK
jgi:EAL domain-containing protein (putative c-di-GMP-specific phosphodiesterase class I)